MHWKSLLSNGRGKMSKQMDGIALVSAANLGLLHDIGFPFVSPTAARRHARCDQRRLRCHPAGRRHAGFGGFVGSELSPRSQKVFNQPPCVAERILARSLRPAAQDRDISDEHAVNVMEQRKVATLRIACSRCDGPGHVMPGLKNASFATIPAYDVHKSEALLCDLGNCILLIRIGYVSHKDPKFPQAKMTHLYINTESWGLASR
jgi:hypothetical protein